MGYTALSNVTYLILLSTVSVLPCFCSTEYCLARTDAAAFIQSKVQMAQTGAAGMTAAAQARRRAALGARNALALSGSLLEAKMRQAEIRQELLSTIQIPNADIHEAVDVALDKLKNKYAEEPAKMKAFERAATDFLGELLADPFYQKELEARADRIVSSRMFKEEPAQFLKHNEATEHATAQVAHTEVGEDGLDKALERASEAWTDPAKRNAMEQAVDNFIERTSSDPTKMEVIEDVLDKLSEHSARLKAGRSGEDTENIADDILDGALQDEATMKVVEAIMKIALTGAADSENTTAAEPVMSMVKKETTADAAVTAAKEEAARKHSRRDEFEEAADRLIEEAMQEPDKPKALERVAANLKAMAKDEEEAADMEEVADEVLDQAFHKYKVEQDAAEQQVMNMIEEASQSAEKAMEAGNAAMKFVEELENDPAKLEAARASVANFASLAATDPSKAEAEKSALDKIIAAAGKYPDVKRIVDEAIQKAMGLLPEFAQLLGRGSNQSTEVPENLASMKQPAALGQKEAGFQQAEFGKKARLEQFEEEADRLLEEAQMKPDRKRALQEASKKVAAMASTAAVDGAEREEMETLADGLFDKALDAFDKEQLSIQESISGLMKDASQDAAKAREAGETLEKFVDDVSKDADKLAAAKDAMESLVEDLEKDPAKAATAKESLQKFETDLSKHPEVEEVVDQALEKTLGDSSRMSVLEDITAHIKNVTNNSELLTSLFGRSFA